MSQVDSLSSAVCLSVSKRALTRVESHRVGRVCIPGADLPLPRALVDEHAEVESAVRPAAGRRGRGPTHRLHCNTPIAQTNLVWTWKRGESTWRSRNMSFHSTRQAIRRGIRNAHARIVLGRGIFVAPDRGRARRAGVPDVLRASRGAEERADG